MLKICVTGMILLFFVLSIAQAELNGNIVFTKSQYTWQGFEQSVLKGGSKLGWWELYQRDVCIIKPDGTGFQQLTEDGLSYRPKWSPDGEKIAFYSGPQPKVTLQVINADGSDRKELVPAQQDIYDFKWSPDSTSIMVYVKSKRAINAEETWIVSLKDGGQTKQMGSSEWARGWNRWAFQGSEIINPDRRLINGLPSGTAWPQWSPNGSYIAFIHNKRLAIANTATVGRPESWRPSKKEPPCDRLGDWSLDSAKLLFFSAGNVCSINADEKGVVNLSMSIANDACWSPDGSMVAYTSTDGRKANTEIFIMKSDGTEHSQLTNTNYFHEDIDWK